MTDKLLFLSKHHLVKVIFAPVVIYSLLPQVSSSDAYQILDGQYPNWWHLVAPLPFFHGGKHLSVCLLLSRECKLVLGVTEIGHLHLSHHISWPGKQIGQLTELQCPHELPFSSSWFSSVALGQLADFRTTKTQSHLTHQESHGSVTHSVCFLWTTKR